MARGRGRAEDGWNMRCIMNKMILSQNCKGEVVRNIARLCILASRYIHRDYA